MPRLTGRSVGSLMLLGGIALLFNMLPERTLLAQQTTRPQMRQPTVKGKEQEQKYSTLVGLVIDSVHLLPLVGATVLLDGTTLSATTNEEGKFRIDSIPPGDYRLAVFHPLLDTLGFSIGTEPLRMGADSIRQVLMGTPSAKSLVARACPAQKRRLGEAAIMGKVLDPDTEVPLAGVRVTFVWTKIDIGRDIGVKRIQQLREATTDSSGSFVLCGVSPEVRGTIKAERGESETAEVELELLPEELLAFQDLRMLDVPLSDSAPQTGEAILSGRVVNKDGAPVADATVSVQGTKISTVTGPDGLFRLVGLPSGTRAVYVRRVGFTFRQIAVNLSAVNPVDVRIELKDAPPMLEAVTVEGKFEAALKKNGFTERKRMGMGRFLGPKDIERRQPINFSSLFQTIPGFRVETGFGGNTIRSTRGSNGCVIIWVDGVQYRETQAGELDSQLLPEQLMAIETYSPVAAPAEFKSAGQSDCSVIVVWTNRTVR
jgi:hypothetical protein